MDIIECGSRPTMIAPSKYFTGAVWQDAIIDAPSPAALRALHVTFAPGARTFWHTHPLGQTLYVVAGAGLAQTWGGPLREIRAGDVIWFAPGEKHWHGASSTNAMVHLAMQEADESGSAVTWLEEVSDAQYRGA